MSEEEKADTLNNSPLGDGGKIINRLICSL